MPDSTSRKIIEYVAEMKDVFAKLRQLDNANKKVAQGLGSNFNQNLKKIGDGYGKISKTDISKLNGNINSLKGTTSQWSQVVRGADGNLVRLTETTKVNQKGVVSSTKSYQSLNKNTVSLGQNFARLAKRAALTIPVWFALRGSITAVFSTIRNGLKDLASFDRALQKLRRNISATSPNVEADFANIKDAITSFSLESGVAVEDISNAIQKFATVGFGVEESLKGGIQATKLSITLFGDATETANAFARSLRVMTEDMNSSEERTKAINDAIALTDQLWKTNAFEVNEFTGNLEKFAGTAKIANLSINDTLSLLATLSTGGLANRAGRLLRSTLLKSLEQIDDINRSLNLGFDPKKQSTIEFLSLLVDNLDKLKTVQGVPEELAKTVKEFFSIRGTEPVAALVALRKTLKENLALRPDLEQFNQEYETQTQQLNRLVDRYHNLNREIGKTFVTGLVGGKDFNDSLSKILITLENLRKGAETFGESMRIAFTLPTFTVGEGLEAEGNKFIQFLDDLSRRTFIGRKVQQSLVNNFNELEENAKKGFERVLKAIQGESSKAEIKELLIDIQQSRFQLPKNLNKEQLEKSLNYQLSKEPIEIKPETKIDPKINKESIFSRTELKTINEAYLNSQLEQLKSEGALNSEILKRENELKKVLGIQDNLETKINKQLELERSLSEEKRLQSRLGSDSIKLFEIAQKEGTQVAKKIGDVLSGNIDFSSFVRRGGKELEIFKEQFSDVFKSKQAEQFFRGERVSGISGLRGGENISIEEENIRQRANVSSFELDLAKRRLEIETQINRLREESLKNTQNAIINNRIAGQGSFQTVINKRNPSDAGITTSVPVTRPTSSVGVIQLGDMKVTINAKNAEDLDNQINGLFETFKDKTKKEIKESILGRQTNTF